MTKAQYVIESARTDLAKEQYLSATERHSVLKLHWIIGLSGELLELNVSPDVFNQSEEYGDIAWYLALGERYTVDLMSQMEMHDELPDIMEVSLVYHIEKLQDSFKREVFYGKKPTPEVDLRHIKAIWRLLDQLVNLEEVLDMNIAKLKARYPSKFTEELALDRDLTKEGEAMQNV